MGPSRRDLLRGATATVLLAGCRARDSAPANLPDPSTGGRVDLDLQLRASGRTIALDGIGGATEVWAFDGQLVSGPHGALTTDPASYLGPTIRVRPHQRLRITFHNQLAEPSIVHWHGLDVSEANDGHPRFAVAPGASYVYNFEVAQRPGTYWYHPHPEGRTGPQVFMGLAGLFIVEDPDDAARGLPTDDHDVALLLQDRTIGRDGALVYAPDAMVGQLGDRVFVNGRPDATIAVDRGSYRLRVINGSNARIYRLAWSNDAPITVIGTDGGLLAAASDKPYVMLAPGERLELWADFASVAQDEVRLESRAFDAGTSMGMGGMMGGRGMGSRNATPPAPPNGAALGVCRFAISGLGPRRTKPTVLTQLERISDAAVSAKQPHRFDVSMSRMRWQLNGSGFAMTEVAANERFTLGATEDWEFTNLSGMMAMPHPIHVHGAQFQIVSRSGAESGVIDDGLVDDGWKDTFLLRPGERVRIRRRSNHAGLFLYHCHNLEHEDAGMMRNFLVET